MFIILKNMSCPKPNLAHKLFIHCLLETSNGISCRYIKCNISRIDLILYLHFPPAALLCPHAHTEGQKVCSCCILGFHSHWLALTSAFIKPQTCESSLNHLQLTEILFEHPPKFYLFISLHLFCHYRSLHYYSSLLILTLVLHSYSSFSIHAALE